MTQASASHWGVILGKACTSCSTGEPGDQPLLRTQKVPPRKEGSVTKYMRIARAVACASILAVPAFALGAETATIRVEGATGTLLSERSANIPTSGTTTLVDSFDGDEATSSNQSGTSLLGRALLDGGLPVGFTNYGPGLGVLITRIGPDAAPAIWFQNAPYWKLKVNHALSSVGASSLVMRHGDQVLWSFGDGTEDELDVVGPSAPQMVGAPFTVHVNRYNDGQTVPGAYGPDYPDYTGRANPPVAGSGVTVTYGSQSVTTDLDGNATLITEGGWGNVVAAGTRVIRDSARACGYPAGAPEACGLDPIVRALPDVAPKGRVTVMTRSGKSITIDLPTPIRGGAPVTISSNDIDSPGLTTAERREVLGRLASALAWQLNDRSAQGDRSLALPGGMRWRAAWLGRSTTVTPLAQGEAVVSQRAQSRTNAAINSRTARVATQRLATCGIDTHASVTRRFGYSMVVVAAPATGARACLARER